MMSETEVTIRQVAAYSNTIANRVINERLTENLDAFLPVDYTEEELEYARRFRKVIPERDAQNLPRQLKMLFDPKEAREALEMPIFNFRAKTNMIVRGSNDVGDVSWVCPTSLFWAACYAAGTPVHTCLLYTSSPVQVVRLPSRRPRDPFYQMKRLLPSALLIFLPRGLA